MEAERENSENIELFWTLFNDAYKVVAGEDTLHFNPKGWCTDMAGANMNGLLRVFGDDVLTRIKTCEFHFKESRNKMARKLDDDDGKVFKELCDQMLASSLETTYLLDAAQIDAKDSILLAAELKAIEKGSSIAFGQGPSFQQKKARSHHQELARAVQLGKDIVSLSDFQIDPNSSHRPPPAKKTKQCNKRNTKKNNEQSSSQKPFTSSQDARTFTQQPSTATPTPVIQPQNTTGVPGNDQSQLNQISAGCSIYSPQPFRAQASSPHHFVPAHDLQQVGTVVIRDPAHHLSDPGPSNQFLYGASHFQLQQQHFSSTSTTPQPPAAATPIPNICHQPLSHRQPAGTNPHYGFRAPYVSQQGTQASWHSGYSPYRYELIELPSKVKKCYGCGLEFSEKYRHSPHNIVVKHVDRRLVRRDEQTGQFHYSADFSNTYYHLDVNHIARKNPVFDGNVYLSISKYQALDAGQHHVISTSNVNIVLV